MSKKSSKLDLLVRVRFENPLPEPPFPPKLLNVNTDIQRLADPGYLDQLASSSQLPMLLDAEMGMPIDLNEYEGVWDGSDAALNPPAADPGRLEPEDAALLAPLRILAGGAGTNGISAGAALKPEVSWMRNTNYIQRNDGAKRRRAGGREKTEDVDASEAAQLLTIQKTFSDIRDQKLEDIRHPDAKRKHLRVVESYNILPDSDAWSNSYIMFKFPERPSAATLHNPSATASSGRLGRAILKPVVEEEQQLIDFFLPMEDDLPRLDELEKQPIGPDAVAQLEAFDDSTAEGRTRDEFFPHVAYERIRTYEVVTQAQPQKEILLTFCEGEDQEEDMFGEDDEQPKSKKRKGVYVKEIRMRSQLRKTRAGMRAEIEARADHWDRARVGFRDPNETETQQWEAAALPVADPNWIEDQLHTGGVEVQNGIKVDQDDIDGDSD